MEDEDSNPETGELSDDAAMEALRNARVADAELEGDDEPETDDEPESEADEPEEAEEEPAKYTVKIDGVESEVTLDELVKGFQLEADYRRKTQSLAEDRRGVQAEIARQKDITALLILEHQKLVGNDEPEPDWVKLSQDDPIGYVQQRAAFEAKRAQREQAKAKAEELVNSQRSEIARAEAQKLRDAVTEWQDPATFTKDYTTLVEGAAKYFRFDAAEVAAVLDHRTLLALRDAVAYRELKASKPAVEKKVATAPKHVVKPGSPAPKATHAKDVEALRNRFRQTGSDEDAVALLRASRSR